MIWLAIGVLALGAMAPLGWALWERTSARSRRAAALDLHRAQLLEVDRDLAQGRIGAPEHAIARLEIERRVLAEAAIGERAGAATRLPLIATLVIVPVAAVLLYLPGSQPGMPAVPLAARLAEEHRQAVQAESLIADLRARMSTLDPHSDQARQGLILLGNLEDTRGNLAAAADDWRQAVTIRFDATLAAQVAEAQSRVDGKVSAESASLFRQALAAGAADAPWRPIAQQRLSEVPAAP